MKSKLVVIAVALVLAVGLVATFATSQPVSAAGPTDIPPGGATVTDDDDGSGETWGRSGGRTFGYSGMDLAKFAELVWGPSTSSPIHIAFDGAVDSAGERLNYAGIPDTGTILYTGTTTVELVAGGGCTPVGPTTVETMAVLTIKDSNGTAAPIITPAISGLPGVDVLALPGHATTSAVSFSATIEMLARNPSSCYAGTGCAPSQQVPVGTFGPVLDVYDCMNTDPGQVDEALTGFNSGFFYELAVEEMTVKEHDDHMVLLIGDLDNDVAVVSGFNNWLEIEWNAAKGGWNDHHQLVDMGLAAQDLVLAGHTDSLQWIMNDTGAIPGMSQQIGDMLSDIQNVSQKQNEISDKMGSLPDLELLLLLFGITHEEAQLPGDPNPMYPPVEALPMIADLWQAVFSRASQDSVDDLVNTLAELDLPNLDVAVSTRASQTSVDSFFDVFTELDLGNAIGSRASQTSVDSFFDVFTELDLGNAIGSRASQTSVDSFFDVFTELDLGNAIGSRASQTSVDSFFDVFTELDLGNAIGSRASQFSVDVLEAKADALEAKADGIQTTVGENSTALATLEGKADALEAKADGIQTTVGENSTALATLEGKADALEAKADATAAAIEALGASANTNAADIAEIKEMLQTIIDYIESTPGVGPPGGGNGKGGSK